MSGTSLASPAFLVVALRSQEKGTRMVLRYPLSDAPGAPETDREPGADGKPPSAMNHAVSHPADDLKDAKEADPKAESTTDLLSPLIPMLFPATSECTCVFTLAAKEYVFITHFVNAQPPDSGDIPEAFIFVLGLQGMEGGDVWSPALAQYKLLLQQFTLACIREHLRCDFLSRELQGLRSLRDKCDNWAEFNRLALQQSELAHEIKTLVDGINKPLAHSVQVRVNGFVLVEMQLPRAGPGPPGSPSSGSDAPQVAAAPPPHTTLRVHPGFAFAQAVLDKFGQAFPKVNLFDTLQFFATAQTLDTYFDRMKLRGKRDGGLRTKSADHLHWLLEHKVLQVVEPHYLLLYTRAAPAVGAFRNRMAPSPGGVGDRAQPPAVLHCDPSLEPLQWVTPEAPPLTVRRGHHRRGDPGPGDWGYWGLQEDDRLDSKVPPRQVEISHEDWQSLLRLAKDPTRAAFEALCEHGLLDGRHSRSAILHRYGVREAMLDHLLHLYSGHILTLWY